MNRPLAVRWFAVALIGLGAGPLGACDRGAAGADAGPSQARPLHMFSTERPDGAHDQARMALAQDAWRREARFLDAVDPGFAFRSTRVTQAEIDAGLWEARDLFQLGGQLFTFAFNHDVGFGGADLPELARFHGATRGGPDTHRCADCHWRGGLAGAGDAADNAFFRGDGLTQSAAVVRNPPAVVGAGYREILGREMTAELIDARDELIAFARANGYAVRIPLQAKGVSFGFLTADPDGTLDYRELEGIDEDLVVKPFGWKGTFASLRDVVEDALLVHHGMQSDYVVQHEPRERIGSGPAEDPDGDGVEHEIGEGQVTAMTLFAAMQDVPTEEPPSTSEWVARYAEGRAQFDRLGCAQCHTPSLPIDSTVYHLPGRLGHDDVEVDLATEGAEPRLRASVVDGSYEVRLYSDLKRHRMGEDLLERTPDKGVLGDTFITPPLWGIARSRPYLHDGRAPTLEDAILLHGGEAQASRDAYAALEEPERAPLRIFLTSLSRGARLVSG